MLATMVQTIVGVILANGTKDSDKETKISKAQQIRRLLKEGKSRSEVAKITNSHYSTVHAAYEKMRKQPLVPEPKLFSKEQRVRCLYDTGMSAKQIAKKVNLPENDVEAMICRYQL